MTTRYKMPEGWITMGQAAERLHTDAATLYERHSRGKLPWGAAILKTVKDPTIRGGQRYCVHEEGLRAWCQAHPATAVRLQRKSRKSKPGAKKASQSPAKKKQGAEKTAPMKPTASTKGAFAVQATRQDCMAVMAQVLKDAKAATANPAPQKIGSLFFDALVARTTTCCAAAAQQILADEKFREFYRKSKFCPLCGEPRA